MCVSSRCRADLLTRQPDRRGGRNSRNNNSSNDRNSSSNNNGGRRHERERRDEYPRDGVRKVRRAVLDETDGPGQRTVADLFSSLAQSYRDDTRKIDE